MRSPNCNMYLLFRQLGKEEENTVRIRKAVSLGEITRLQNVRYNDKDDGLDEVWKSYQNSAAQSDPYGLDTLLRRCVLLRKLPTINNIGEYILSFRMLSGVYRVC